MRRDQVHPFLGQGCVQRIAVVGTIADQVLRLGFQHVEVETQLHQRHLVMVRRMRADRQRQPVAIHNRQDFHAFSAFGRAYFIATALGKGEGGVDEALPLIDHPLLPQCIGQVGQDVPQHVLTAPLLEAPMHGLVVGKRLRKPVPLRAGVEDPQHRLEDRAGRHRLAARTIVRVVLLGKMFPNPLPVLIAQSPHAASVKAASGPHNSFEIGSRSFEDRWSRNSRLALYRSSIANLISAYVSSLEADTEKVKEFKIKKRDGNLEGEEAVVDRFSQLTKMVRTIALGDPKNELEELSTLGEIVADGRAQRALLNHEIPPESIQLIKAGNSFEFEALLRLILVSSYVLSRVAITVVRGKNEHYAFTVFESLNTTGEPLTAYETFKPRVVSAETLEAYEASKARECVDEVSGYLATFPVGEKLQVATRDMLISFAAAETGVRLSKRLADQRRYLKEEFERHEADPVARHAFVRNLRDVSKFIEGAWKQEGASLHGLPADATTDSVKLCLAFLSALNHSITIAPLSRFYAKSLASNDEARPQAIKDFEIALKAMTAFSVLWRASRRTTGNIDSEYRDLLLGLGEIVGDQRQRSQALAPLARSLRLDAPVGAPQPQVDVEILKQWLRSRLGSDSHGGIPDRDTFVREGSKLPSYAINKNVTRFMLLAAYHDAVEDPAVPGLIIPGRSGVSQCLMYEGFVGEKHLTLEHIAPQQKSEGWDTDIWTERERVNSLGNLVLAPRVENASLSNRTWAEKRVLYGALSARSQHEAELQLAQSGIDFGPSTQELAKRAEYLPHLHAVSLYPEAWSSEFIRIRSERLHALAYDRLIQWLE